MSTDDAQQYAQQAAYQFDDRGGRYLAVLLHGLGGDRNQPLGLTRDQLAGTGTSVLAPDARAHGDTGLIGAPERFTTAALAQDVLALIDRLGLQDRQLIPVGISMGAAVGLHLIRHHPDQVAGAVLIRPSFGTTPWPEHLQIFRTAAALLRQDGPAGLAAFQQTAEFQDMLRASASAAGSMAEQFTKPQAAQRVVRLETVPGNVSIDWTGTLDLGRPVTVVAAIDDPGHPVDVAALWHHRLTGSDLITVPSRDQHPADYTDELEQAVTRCITAWTTTTVHR